MGAGEAMAHPERQRRRLLELFRQISDINVNTQLLLAVSNRCKTGSCRARVRSVNVGDQPRKRRCEHATEGALWQGVALAMD